MVFRTVQMLFASSLSGISNCNLPFTASSTSIYSLNKGL
jgi:hypothetical protein